MTTPYAPPSASTAQFQKVPSAPAALLLFSAVLGANFALSALFQTWGIDLEWLLLATPAVLLLLTGLFMVALRLDPVETLLLRLPVARDFWMAIPLGLSFVVLSDQLAGLTSHLLPGDLVEKLREVQLDWLSVSSPGEWILKLATIGLGAAVSEELLCRGFLQAAFLRRIGPLPAIAATSVLFMLLHILPLPSFLAAGLVLGISAMASRSIVVPVVVHFLNNTAALVLVNLAGLETLTDPVWVPAKILLPAILVFALALAYYWRRLREG
jgi:membrane protease YdiL (CAAX protease family)